MTNKEAINFLNGYLIDDVYTKDCVKSHKIAISAIKKQIPEKVTHEATKLECCTCPNCTNVVDDFTDFAGQKVRVTFNYCKFCGQTLDWSDLE